MDQTETEAAAIKQTALRAFASLLMHTLWLAACLQFRFRFRLRFAYHSRARFKHQRHSDLDAIDGYLNGERDRGGFVIVGHNVPKIGDRSGTYTVLQSLA